ncbi:MAG: hypothetical protein KAT77_02775 [Nanoarchaeota archaeon]|nr:hypothetical protein [Nanoarchaeota archaeon]
MKEKQWNLGIDESNHGRYPEVIVGVYSYFRKDILLNSGLSRRYKKTIFSEFGLSRKFKHIIIPREYEKILGKEGITHNIKVIAYAELIKSFFEESGENLSKVLIDGEMRESDLERLARVLHPIRMPETETIPKADSKYPIVNFAHRIARKLFREYIHNSDSEEITDFLDNLVTPKIEDYKGMLIGN